MVLDDDSDQVVYRTERCPHGVTSRPIEITQALERSTCLDMYLDNVMANVPELVGQNRENWIAESQLNQSHFNRH
jgi:hypothetical protein